MMSLPGTFSSFSAAAAAAAWLLAAGMLLSLPESAHAWGGLFNRYNPALMDNGGYGGHGGSYGRELFRVAEENKFNKQVPDPVEEVLAAEATAALASAAAKADATAGGGDPCVDRQCASNEHCCDGHVCVDTDESETMGTCLPIWGHKQGEICYRDHDCESGYECLDSPSDTSQRTCQTPSPGQSLLGEDCRTSSDCNTHKGLCCRLHRRARSQPKKICVYFTDPLVCIGHVSGEPRNSYGFEHTAGEKRQSGHPDDLLYTRK